MKIALACVMVLAFCETLLAPPLFYIEAGSHHVGDESIPSFAYGPGGVPIPEYAHLVDPECVCFELDFVWGSWWPMDGDIEIWVGATSDTGPQVYLNDMLIGAVPAHEWCEPWCWHMETMPLGPGILHAGINTFRVESRIDEPASTVSPLTDGRLRYTPCKNIPVRTTDPGR